MSEQPHREVDPAANADAESEDIPPAAQQPAAGGPADGEPAQGEGAADSY